MNSTHDSWSHRSCPYTAADHHTWVSHVYTDHSVDMWTHPHHTHQLGLRGTAEINGQWECLFFLFKFVFIFEKNVFCVSFVFFWYVFFLHKCLVLIHKVLGMYWRIDGSVYKQQVLADFASRKICWWLFTLKNTVN